MNQFSDIEKNLYLNFLMNHQEELFEMIVILVEERIKSLVPNMVKEYIQQNPQEVILDTREAENQIANLFKNIKV